LPYYSLALELDKPSGRRRQRMRRDRPLTNGTAAADEQKDPTHVHFRRRTATAAAGPWVTWAMKQFSKFLAPKI
jgi:hypothetical protein